jgi:hypothetical protein
MKHVATATDVRKIIYSKRKHEKSRHRKIDSDRLYIKKLPMFGSLNME